MDDLRSMLQEMRSEHRADHAELKAAIAKLAADAARANTEQAVHAAVCNAEREDMQKNIEKNRASIWKILTAVIGGGSAAGGTVAWVVESLIR